MKMYKKGHLLSVNYDLYQHVGISDGNGNVYENSRKRGGSGLVPNHIFSSGKSISDHGTIGNFSANEILERAKRLITDQSSYKLISNNCEHFIRTIYGVEVTSPQLKKVLIALGAFELLYQSKTPLIQYISAGAGIGACVSSHTSETDNVIRNSLLGVAVGLFAFAISEG